MKFSFWILKFLPKNHLSYWVGKAMHLNWPQPLRRWLIKSFASGYKIRWDEAERPLSEYKSIGDFFVRKLKNGVRPLGTEFVVHPADAVLTQFSRIKNGQLIQAKGKFYSVAGLLAQPENSETVNRYNQGSFAVYYLCPTDYHRVHSPVAGEIVSVTWIPGSLWPVNKVSVESVSDLFAVNERVVVEIRSEKGHCAVVFVGATNVGKIVLSFESRVITNNLKQKENVFLKYPKPLPIQKGDELGQFQMGSTVVMLADQELSKQWPVELAAQFLGQATKVRASF